MEKKIKIISMEDEQNDFSYWITKSYQERIDAIEALRSQYSYFTQGLEKQNVQPRLQRVLKIIKRK